MVIYYYLLLLFIIIIIIIIDIIHRDRTIGVVDDKLTYDVSNEVLFNRICLLTKSRSAEDCL